MDKNFTNFTHHLLKFSHAFCAIVNGFSFIFFTFKRILFTLLKKIRGSFYVILAVSSISTASFWYVQEEFCFKMLAYCSYFRSLLFLCFRFCNAFLMPIFNVFSSSGAHFFIFREIICVTLFL